MIKNILLNIKLSNQLKKSVIICIIGIPRFALVTFANN